MNNYYNKYLKYKAKYLALKKHIGGIHFHRYTFPIDYYYNPFNRKIKQSTINNTKIELIFKLWILYNIYCDLYSPELSDELSDERKQLIFKDICKKVDKYLKYNNANITLNNMGVLSYREIKVPPNIKIYPHWSLASIGGKSKTINLNSDKYHYTPNSKNINSQNGTMECSIYESITMNCNEYITDSGFNDFEKYCNIKIYNMLENIDFEFIMNKGIIFLLFIVLKGRNEQDEYTQMYNYFKQLFGSRNNDGTNIRNVLENLSDYIKYFNEKKTGNPRPFIKNGDVFDTNICFINLLLNTFTDLDFLTDLNNFQNNICPIFYVNLENNGITYLKNYIQSLDN